MKKPILFTLLLLFISSCSPTQRLERLLAKHPELGKPTTIVKDVLIYETDTFIVDEHKLDTTISSSKDTITFEDSIIYVQMIKNDTVYQFKTLVKERTIVVHDTIKYSYLDTVNVFNYKGLTFKEKSKYRGQGMGIMLLIILLLIIIWQGIRLYLKGQFPILNLLK